MRIIQLENEINETSTERNERKARVLDEIYEKLQFKLMDTPPPWWWLSDVLNLMVQINKKSIPEERRNPKKKGEQNVYF